MTQKTSTVPVPEAASEWYVSALESLLGVSEELSYARDLNSVMNIVRAAARELTGADGATFVLRDGDNCYYAEENAISPLWKGQRFPMSICISGWVMMNAQSAFIEDIYADERIPVAAYRPTFVKSLAMVPIRTNNPLGAIGNYWATNYKPDAEEIAILEGLANITAIALENVSLNDQLQEKMSALEASNFELSRFAWIASHDLKSPLRAIDHLAQWIENDSGDALYGDSKLHLQYLRQRVHRMEKLIDDFLAFAHKEKKFDVPETEMIDGKGLIKDIKELIDIPPYFAINIDDNFYSVRVPHVPFLQVLSSLVNNAIKHHDKDQGHIRITATENEIDYIFSVQDDGPGIPADQQDVIFEMFEKAQPADNAANGHGMGLSFASKILSLYGGKIKVESGPDRGSIFRFTWPKKRVSIDMIGRLDS